MDGADKTMMGVCTELTQRRRMNEEEGYDARSGRHDGDGIGGEGIRMQDVAESGWEREKAGGRK
jgi:hypothetical protein